MNLSGEAFGRAAGRSYDELDRDAASRLKKDGIEVIVASDDFVAELRKLMAPIEEQWIAQAKKLGVDGVAALQMLREEVKKQQ